MVEELATLFARAEVYIYIFMEITTKLSTVQRVLLKRANWKDNVFFILLFGVFSIICTYLGITLPTSGAILNIRDLGPMVAGLVAGWPIGVAVGLIGGIHRFFLGGITAFSCGLATVFAGLIGGLIYKVRKGSLIGVLLGMLVAIIVEIVHAGITLLIARPFEDALFVVQHAIPAMMIANSLGIAVSIIVIAKEIRENTSSVHADS
jgi:phosphoserine phosphatase RsbU/P